jgi:hypothetical protein
MTNRRDVSPASYATAVRLLAQNPKVNVHRKVGGLYDPMLTFAGQLFHVGTEDVRIHVENLRRAEMADEGTIEPPDFRALSLDDIRELQAELARRVAEHRE